MKGFRLARVNHKDKIPPECYKQMQGIYKINQEINNLKSQSSSWDSWNNTEQTRYNNLTKNKTTQQISVQQAQHNLDEIQQQIGEYNKNITLKTSILDILNSFIDEYSDANAIDLQSNNEINNLEEINRLDDLFHDIEQ